MAQESPTLFGSGLTRRERGACRNEEADEMENQRASQQTNSLKGGPVSHAGTVRQVEPRGWFTRGKKDCERAQEAKVARVCVGASVAENALQKNRADGTRGLRAEAEGQGGKGCWNNT